MKKLFTLFVAVLLTASMLAQSPEKMSYQAVIRDASDNLVTSQTVGMQITILQGSASGTAVYIETQTPTTNANGLVSIEIGDGTVLSGDFITIDWANGPYFIKTETDPAGNTSYSITGTSQLLSVPYALHAKTAETVTGGITEADPVYSGSDAANITATDITNLSNLSGTNTGDQDLSTLATNTALGDSTAQVRSEIPDISGFLTSETDPVFTAWDKSTGISITESQISDLDHFTTADETDPVYISSQAAYITATDITNLSNLSGTNTGDQDISTLATKTELGDSTAQVRSEIPDVSGFITGETDPVFGASPAVSIEDADLIRWNEAYREGSLIDVAGVNISGLPVIDNVGQWVGVMPEHLHSVDDIQGVINANLWGGRISGFVHSGYFTEDIILRIDSQLPDVLFIDAGTRDVLITLHEAGYNRHPEGGESLDPVQTRKIIVIRVDDSANSVTFSVSPGSEDIIVGPSTLDFQWQTVVLIDFAHKIDSLGSGGIWIVKEW